MTETIYDGSFYAAQADGSYRSSREMVPFILEIAAPRSVLDVGCGVGTWLRSYRDCGVSDCLGLDGDWVDVSQLRVPSVCFQPTDLAHTPALRRRFDLAQCLEVAEHLPPSAADGLVKFLTTAADVVVFSAGSPHQGGANHLNEQWPEYWRKLFDAQGFAMFDPFRPRFWSNECVEWWYAQNTFLYVNRQRQPQLPVCAALGEGYKYPERVVHPHRIDPAHQNAPGLLDFLRSTPQQLVNACKETVSRRMPNGAAERTRSGSSQSHV